MNRQTVKKTIGTRAVAGMLGVAACDYIHDDTIAPCEYTLRFVYDYNMKFADAFQNEVTKAALFICDQNGNFLQRRDIEGTELDGTVQNRLASLRRSIAGITV